MFGLTHGRTWLDLKIFLPDLMCIITVSPSTLVNLYVPSYFFGFCLNTNTGDPASRFRRDIDVSIPFCPDGFFGPKLIPYLYYSLSTSFLSASMVCACCSFVVAGFVCAGLFIAPNTRSIGQSPSGTMVEFTANTASLRHSLSSCVLSRSFHILICTDLNGSLYRFIVSIIPG